MTRNTNTQHKHHAQHASL